MEKRSNELGWDSPSHEWGLWEREREGRRGREGERGREGGMSGAGRMRGNERPVREGAGPPALRASL